MKELRLFLRKIDQKVISKGKHYLLTLIILYRYKTNEVLDHYKEQTPQKEEPIGATSPIWVCWWQGEKKMPDIVKACYSSICRHADNHPVILITEKNFQEYATMPDFIMQRLYKREMTITHFSDLLRMNLLKRHGGIWLDSTILLTKDIDSIINTSLPYYSHHHIPNNCNVVKGKWTGFFLACGKGNILPSFILDAFYNYWKNNNRIVTYLFIDYLFALAYKHIPAVSKMVNNIPVQPMSNLSKCLNQEYDKKAMETFYTKYHFHFIIFLKLTYKKAFAMQTRNGKKTIYAHLLTDKAF